MLPATTAKVKSTAKQRRRQLSPATPRTGIRSADGGPMRVARRPRGCGQAPVAAAAIEPTPRRAGKIGRADRGMKRPQSPSLHSTKSTELSATAVAAIALGPNHKIARGRGRRRQLAEMTPEERKIEKQARMERMRVSARECRLRKKVHTESLERKVAAYEETFKVNNIEIDRLRRQVSELQACIVQLRAEQFGGEGVDATCPDAGAVPDISPNLDACDDTFAAASFSFSDGYIELGGSGSGKDASTELGRGVDCNSVHRLMDVQVSLSPAKRSLPLDFSCKPTVASPVNPASASPTPATEPLSGSPGSPGSPLWSQTRARSPCGTKDFDAQLFNFAFDSSAAADLGAETGHQ